MASSHCQKVEIITTDNKGQSWVSVLWRCRYYFHLSGTKLTVHNIEVSTLTKYRLYEFRLCGTKWTVYNIESMSKLRCFGSKSEAYNFDFIKVYDQLCSRYVRNLPVSQQSLQIKCKLCQLVDVVSIWNKFTWFEEHMLQFDMINIQYYCVRNTVNELCQTFCSQCFFFSGELKYSTTRLLL